MTLKLVLHGGSELIKVNKLHISVSIYLIY